MQIPDEELVRLVERVKPAADTMEDVPTEFEIITALGMLYFAQQKCEIVVLEAGLGGTLDSTNADAPEMRSHHGTGNGSCEGAWPHPVMIAAAKAGIIKEGCPVVSYGGVPEADAVIRRVAAEKHAEHPVTRLISGLRHGFRTGCKHLLLFSFSKGMHLGVHLLNPDKS